MNERVPLTLEVLAERQRHETEMRLTLEKLLRERDVARSRALHLQAREYERRLKDLNHEASRLKRAAALAVSRELYDADREATNRRLATLEKIESADKAKQSMVDPAIEKLVATVERLAQIQDMSRGAKAGVNQAWLWLIGLVGLVSTIVAAFSGGAP